MILSAIAEKLKRSQQENALFAGSDEGAENWAMLASLIETCKLHGINPHAYRKRSAVPVLRELRANG
jgi:hypothetical protein